MKYLRFTESTTYMYYEESYSRIKYGEFSVLLVSLNIDKIYKIIKIYFDNLKKGGIEELKRDINEVDKLKHLSARYYLNFVHPLIIAITKEYDYMGEFLITVFSDLVTMEIDNIIEEKINIINNTHTLGEADYLKLQKAYIDDIVPELKTLKEDINEDLKVFHEHVNTYNNLEEQLISEQEEIEKCFNEIINANDSTKLWENINRIKNNLKAINFRTFDSKKNTQIYEAILDIMFHIPISLYDKQFHEELKEVVLRKESLFHSYNLNELISKSKVLTSQKPNEDNGLDTIYHFLDINSLLWIDLQKYIKSGSLAKYCEYCERLFIQRSNRKIKYCSFPNKDTKLKCFDLHRKEENDFRKEVKRARGNQQRFVYNAKHYSSKKYEYDFLKLDKIYNEWLLEMSAKYKEFKEKDDLLGLKEWVESTKLTVGEMERLEIRKRLSINKM